MPSPNTQPALPDRTDVVIVGGGVMGTSAAFFLTTETDRDVTLIEKDAIASGSSGDSSAIIRHHYGDQERYTRMARWSHEFYREFEAHTGAKLAYDGNRLVRFATEGATGAGYVEAGHDVMSALDIPTTRYERESFDEEFPMLALDGFDFAVSDDTAAYSDGTDAANGFARAARERGATVVTDTAVEGFRTDAGAITGVETEDGPVECDSVVLAAGPWTARLAGTLGLEIPIEVTREQVVILDPPDEYAETYREELTPTTALSGGEWYIRPDFGEGILVATHHVGETVDPDAYDNQPDEDRLLELTERLAETIPELGEAGIRGQYCGVYSTTPDHDFIIDRAGPDGLYLACGFSGHGFKQAPAVGRILADLIRDGDTDLVDVEFFSLSRFEDDPEGHGLPDDLA